MKIIVFNTHEEVDKNIGLIASVDNAFVFNGENYINIKDRMFCDNKDIYTKNEFLEYVEKVQELDLRDRK